MVVLGGVIGAILGFTIAVVFTEVVFSGNGGSWPDVIPFAVAVFGWLVGTSTVRSIRGRRTLAP